MKELINDPQKPKYQPTAIVETRQQKDIPPSPSVVAAAYTPKAGAERVNNLVNERELQKNKLQNQKHEGLFPSSSDHNRVRSYGKQNVPEQDRNVSPKPYQPMPASPRRRHPTETPQHFDPSFNPFVKDDAL